MSQRKVQLIAEVKGNLDKELKKIGSEMKVVATAAIALGAATFAMSKKMADAGAYLYDMSAATGVSIQSLQSLGYVLAQTGGSAEGAGTVYRALNSFLRTAATGAVEYTEVLGAVGLKYEDLIQMQPQEIFESLTDGIGRLTDVTQQNVVATTIFGARYSQQVLGALRQTGGSLATLTAQFEANGQAMTDDQVVALKQYSDALTDVEYTTKKMMADAIVPLIPTIQEAIEKLMPLAQELLPELVDVGEDVIEALGEMIDFLLGGVEAVGGMKRASEILVAAFVGLKVAVFAYNVQMIAAKAGTTTMALALGRLRAAAILAKGAMGSAGLGLAIAFTVDQLIKLKSAMDDAEDAVDQLHEAEQREGETTREMQIVLVEQARAIREGNIPALIAFREELERMRFGEHATGISSINDALNTMSMEQITDSLEGVNSALEWHQSLISSSTSASVQAEIARLQGLKTELEGMGMALQTAANTSTVTGTAGAPEGDGVGGAADIASQAKLQATLEGIKDEYNARIEARAEYDAMVKAARLEEQRSVLEGIRHKRDIELNAQQEVADAEAAKQEAARASLHKWALDFGAAMMSGKDGAKQWGKEMWTQVKKILAMKGLEVLLNLVTGGAGGSVFGQLAGFLGFLGGGITPIPAAGGLSGVPISSSIQGDQVPVMMNPSEHILTNQQMQEARQQSPTAGGGTTVQMNFQSTLGPHSAATQAELIPYMVEALRVAGVPVQGGVTL